MQRTNIPNKITPLRILRFSLLLLLVIAIIGCTTDKTPGVEKAQSDQLVPQKLAGKWLRPDGGYTLELGNIAEDGGLAAAYFNPQPINVGVSQWRRHESKLQVFVKFDDEYYPGSYYSLEYVLASDQLVGTYFQAVQGESYFVEFVRQEQK